jgi:hypothetical protein
MDTKLFRAGVAVAAVAARRQHRRGVSKGSSVCGTCVYANASSMRWLACMPPQHELQCDTHTTRHSLPQHPSVAAAAFSLVHINPHRAPCTGGSCCCHQQGPSLRTGQTPSSCCIALLALLAQPLTAAHAGSLHSSSKATVAIDTCHVKCIKVTSTADVMCLSLTHYAACHLAFPADPGDD